MSFSDGFIEVDGCRTRLRRGGRGQPLLYLHGASRAAGVAAPGVQPADIFLMPPEEVVKALFFDQKLAAARLAEPVTPEAVDIGLKNRHTTARLAWEPRLHDPFLPKWLHRIEVPVKIVWGAQDHVLPVGIAHELKRLLPRAELKIFEQCGHLPHVEKMEEFCDLLVRFACR